jgi:hypothetical protein
MKKALVSVAFNKTIVGDYLLPLNLKGKDFLKWSFLLLKQKNILEPDHTIKRIMVKTGNSRRDMSLTETLGEAGTKDGSLISIL